jgi:hypothetical protein
MRFKPILLLCTLPLMLLLSTCKDEDVLPDATQNGSNTFGCKVNGKVWLPSGNDNLFAYIEEIDGAFFISASTRTHEIYTSSYMNVQIPDLSSIGTYQIDGAAEEAGVFFFTNTPRYCYYGGYPTDSGLTSVVDGSITITKYDMQNFIIAGIFEATLSASDCDTIRITEGRFDYKVR